jgi:adenosylmethionine---8-amino-7-oxononanoate aminotransferase
VTYLRRDSVSVWHPYTPTPHLGPKGVLVSAEGSFVYDDGGRRYLDGTSSWWCITHGHCNARMAQALFRQSVTLDQVLFSPHTHPVAVDLSEALLKSLRGRFQRVFFSDDGSTAVEAAMKMALQYWVNHGIAGRDKFLSIERAYHGDTLGAVAVSDVKEFHKYFGQIQARAAESTVPYCYRCPLGLTYPDCQIACVEKAEAVLEQDWQKIAAVIVEPFILGAGGMIVYPIEYLQRLVAKAREHATLVIFDEVFTGFGRTGEMFAMDYLDVSPDIVCLSKGLTGGMMPMGATVTTEEVYSAFAGGSDKTLHHGHTFTANALGCAVALESLKIFEDEKVIERNRALIALMAAQTPRFEALAFVGNVRQIGMIWAVELVVDKETRQIPEPPNGPGWKICENLWKAGFWLRPIHQTLYVIPPYSTTKEDLTRLFNALYTEVQNGDHFR